MLSPFALVKQALTHASFPRSDTPGYINDILTEVEDAITNSPTGFDLEDVDKVVEVVKNMQDHLIELLTEKEVISTTEVRKVIREEDLSGVDDDSDG
jgi:hypothetical protein